MGNKMKKNLNFKIVTIGFFVFFFGGGVYIEAWSEEQQCVLVETVTNDGQVTTSDSCVSDGQELSVADLCSLAVMAGIKHSRATTNDHLVLQGKKTLFISIY